MSVVRKENDFIENVIKKIDKGFGIIASFPIYESIYYKENLGYLPIPKEDDEPIGYHAVGIISYSREDRCFMFVNTWGPKWGDKGHGYLPFGYLERKDLSIEIYAIEY